MSEMTIPVCPYCTGSNLALREKRFTFSEVLGVLPSGYVRIGDLLDGEVHAEDTLFCIPCQRELTPTDIGAGDNLRLDF